jgi:hypothetical protein
MLQLSSRAQRELEFETFRPRDLRLNIEPLARLLSPLSPPDNFPHKTFSATWAFGYFKVVAYSSYSLVFPSPQKARQYRRFKKALS